MTKLEEGRYVDLTEKYDKIFLEQIEKLTNVYVSKTYSKYFGYLKLK